MAVIIDQRLAADPRIAKTPRATIVLSQTLHSDLGGEAATITYSLDGRSAIHFETPQGLSKTQVFQAQVPADPTQRTDTVVLVEDGDTGMAQVEIRQLIQAETQVRDSVTLEVEDVD